MRELQVIWFLMPVNFHFKKVLKVSLDLLQKHNLEHYEKTLGAYHFKNQRMIIETQSAKFLVEKYFKN